MSWDSQLLAWYKKNGRKLPWRTTTNSYYILVSECMLQQTQVERVIPKYLLWIHQFPTWNALANAKRSAVLIAWSGLGYNSRAVRLHTLAKLLVQEYSGKLPKDEETLKKLPGLGPYTAGAVRSFAFDLPGNCVDVNVARVISRTSFTKRQRPKRSDIEKKLFSLQQQHSPRALANALMDLGSLHCIARNPSCDSCPVRSDCLSKGVRNEEHRARAKKKTVTFKHSNRWWRGQILKNLTKGPNFASNIFLEICKEPTLQNEESFQSAIAQLQAERLIQGKTKLTLAE